MRKLLAVAVLGLVVMGIGGCLYPEGGLFQETRIQYPDKMVSRHYNEQDQLRLLEDDWDRFWMLDRPTQLNLYRED